MRTRSVTMCVLVCMAIVWITGCGGSSTPSGASGSVRSFDEIRSGAVSFERDPSDPTRAILHVTTRVPAICAIVWGVDDHFGRFNNSQSMNGTGITAHDVVLPDVRPGVTYTYVLEGVTADGTLYRSAVGRFTGDGAAVPSTSVAAAAIGKDITKQAHVVAVSSEYSAAFAGSNAIDGNTSTEWATKGDGDHASITLDLGSAIDIKGVEFVTRSMADGSAITSNYTVTIDGDAAQGPFPAATVSAPRPASISAHGRLVRFDVAKTTGGNVGAVEIRVFG